MFLVVFHVHHFPSKNNRRFSKLKWFKVIQEELYKPVVRVLVKFYANILCQILYICRVVYSEHFFSLLNAALFFQGLGQTVKQTLTSCYFLFDSFIKI